MCLPAHLPLPARYLVAWIARHMADVPIRRPMNAPRVQGCRLLPRRAFLVWILRRLGVKAEGKKKPVTPRIRKGEMPTLTDFRRPDLCWGVAQHS